MSKKELLVGAALWFVLLVLLLCYVADIAKWVGQSAVAYAVPETARVALGWALTGSTGLLLVVAIVLVWRAKGRGAQMLSKLTLRAAIPGAWLLALLPVGAGISLMVITGMVNWGMWLACLSVPTMFMLFFLALKQYRAE